MFTNTEGKQKISKTPKGQTEKSFLLITRLVKRTPPTNVVTLDDNTVYAYGSSWNTAVLITGSVVHQLFACSTEGNRPFKQLMKSFTRKPCTHEQRWRKILHDASWWSGLHHTFWKPHMSSSAPYVQGLKLEYRPGRCHVHEQLSCPVWLAQMVSLMHHCSSSHTNKLLGSMQVSFGRPLRHTVCWPGFIRFEYCLCILHVPEELLLSKGTRFQHH